MRTFAVVAFLAGLLLAVRVMFFGVRRVDADRFHHRKWPLALAAFLATGGAFAYLRQSRPGSLTAGWIGLTLVAALAAGAGAWWLVRKSAAIPSTDPDDDPRYRFQGHVAQVTEPIEAGVSEHGRIAFDFDGKRHDLRARWSTSEGVGAVPAGSGLVGSEVVIEIIDGDVAYVEPWTVVEKRL